MLQIPDLLARVETKVDFIEKTMATKADLAQFQIEISKAMNKQTRKFTGTAIGMSALFAVIAFGLAKALS